MNLQDKLQSLALQHNEPLEDVETKYFIMQRRLFFRDNIMQDDKAYQVVSRYYQIKNKDLGKGDEIISKWKKEANYFNK